MVLDGHSREDTNANPFRDFADNLFSGKKFTIRITYICNKSSDFYFMRFRQVYITVVSTN